jgi:metal-responsive CopG/Arc/MetJ family transcriptional regulator
MLKDIKKLTEGEEELYPSRSELIRVAVREFLITELEAAKTFEKFQHQTLFSQVYPPKIEETPKKILKKVNVGDKTYNIIPREQIFSQQ